MHLHLEHAYLICIIFLACADELDLVTRLDGTVDDLEICNDTSERVEDRVKDKSLKRRIRISLWSRYPVDDCIKDRLDTLTGLA